VAVSVTDPLPQRLAPDVVGAGGMALIVPVTIDEALTQFWALVSVT
jgi:hypothetical protein